MNKITVIIKMDIGLKRRYSNNYRAPKPFKSLNNEPFKSLNTPIKPIRSKRSMKKQIAEQNQHDIEHDAKVLTEFLHKTLWGLTTTLLMAHGTDIIKRIATRNVQNKRKRNLIKSIEQAINRINTINQELESKGFFESKKTLKEEKRKITLQLVEYHSDCIKDSKISAEYCNKIKEYTTDVDFYSEFMEMVEKGTDSTKLTAFFNKVGFKKGPTIENTDPLLKIFGIDIDEIYKKAEENVEEKVKNSVRVSETDRIQKEATELFQKQVNEITNKCSDSLSKKQIEMKKLESDNKSLITEINKFRRLLAENVGSKKND